MIRLTFIPALILLLLMQIGTPFLCTALAKNQAGMSSAAACCPSQKPQPFQKPAGMPDSQCCFKAGPLLSKAMVPDHVDLNPDLVIVALTSVIAMLSEQPLHQSGKIELPDRSPPSQPLLQVFRI